MADRIVPTIHEFEPLPPQSSKARKSRKKQKEKKPRVKALRWEDHPGERLRGLLKAKYPGEFIPDWARHLEVATEHLNRTLLGYPRHNLASPRARLTLERFAQVLGVTPEDIIGHGTPLDEILGSEEAFTHFMGVELTTPLRKWAIELIKMIQAERNKQWHYLVRRQVFLTDGAKRRAVIKKMAEAFRTSEENIENAIEHTPEWQERFEQLVKKTVIRKKNFRRSSPIVPRVIPKAD